MEDIRKPCTHKQMDKKISSPVICIVIICLLIVSFGAGCSPKDADYQSISMAQATERMDENKDYTLVDVRSFKEYASGHIPGAICIPNENIEETVKEQLPETDELIMVYCRTGHRSKQAAGKLVKLGYTNIVEIGGINSWNGDVIQETAED